MSRVAKNEVAAVMDRIGANIIDAAGVDGIASRKDLKAKIATLATTSKTEAALTDRFFRFIDHRDFAGGARVTGNDVAKALEYAKVHLLANYDVNGNGYSKTEIGKMSRSGQLAVTLALELKGVAAPKPTMPTSELGKAFTKAAVDTYYYSEGDSQPAFVSAAFPASRAITGEAIMEAFHEHLVSEFDEQDRDLSNYTFELESPADSAKFLKGLTEFEADDDDYIKDNAAGFARIRKVFDDNLTDVRVIRVGWRDEDDPAVMSTDQGAYEYLIVGRTADGKLAGVAFESVET